MTFQMAGGSARRRARNSGSRSTAGVRLARGARTHRRRRAQPHGVPHAPLRGGAGQRQRGGGALQGGPRRYASEPRGHASRIAMVKCRRILSRVKIDRTQPKPVVSLIGEFWAMTTEGDGNYHMQRFLEQEGAEVDIQGITNWILFLLWEAGLRHRAAARSCARDDDARKGLTARMEPKKIWGLKARVLRGEGRLPSYANLLRAARLPPARHARDRRSSPGSTTATMSAAAKATWRSASSSTSWSTRSTT